MKFLWLSLICVLLSQVQALELESVSDDDLVHVIKRHSYAVVLFSK